MYKRQALENPQRYTDVPEAWLSKQADMEWRATAVLNAIDAHVLRSERVS